MNVLLLVFLSNLSHSIFFFEAETKEGLDLTKGSILTAIFLEEAANIEDNNGISLNQFENALSRHDESSREFIGNARMVENDTSILYSTEYMKNAKRKTAQDIKNVNRLIKTLCSLGPESCVAANTHLMINQQRETNDLLRESLIQTKLEKLNNEQQKLVVARKTKESIKTINDLPNIILRSLAERIN